MTEAKAVNQIGHEHIVDIADFGNTPDGEFYFVMEYLQGESLSDRLRRETRIDVGARAVGRRADRGRAQRLARAGDHPPRPEAREHLPVNNRGLSRDFVKVLDFGLAKLTQSEQKVTHKTRTGSVMGTPYYMSPEQCEGKIEIDHRADIYSLGVLLFEMLTGKVPFGGDGYGEIIVKHVTMPPPSIRSVVPELPEYLDSSCIRALAKDRDQRFQTMSELRRGAARSERYVSSAPEIGIPDDLSRHRARGGADGALRRWTRARRSASARGSRPATKPPGGIPSTFREGRGELIEHLIPKRRRGQAFLFVGIAACVGAAVVLFGPRRETRQPLPAAPVPLHPSSVRINFNSDPDGAIVMRGDGKTLGLTPLSIEVPYSDSAVEFMFRKAGYENEDRVRRPEPAVAAVRDAAQDRDADRADRHGAAAGELACASAQRRPGDRRVDRRRPSASRRPPEAGPCTPTTKTAVARARASDRTA